MTFSEPQLRKLKAKLKPSHIRVRAKNGVNLNYIEGWHAIAEANRIFGHDGWDRRTVSTTCVAADAKGDRYHAAYMAKVRVTVRAGETLIVREGTGTGEGRALTPGQAHELAVKGAETDATKRALATFGNPFGLTLYERDSNGLRRPEPIVGLSSSTPKGPWRLRSSKGVFTATLNSPEAFAAALQDAMAKAEDIEHLFEVWEQNVETVRAIHKEVASKQPGYGKRLVAHLKSRAISLVQPKVEKISPPDPSANEAGSLAGYGTKIDKSVLTLGTIKRHRSREHLRFVAQQPCLICGRSPSQAHHVRYAQPKGVGLKVSDEFAVPLCVIHHNENHRTGDEKGWWEKHKVDPITTAEALWKRSAEIRRHPTTVQPR